MAYNNPFPIGYQPAQIYYPQQYQAPTSPTMPSGTFSQQGNGIIWVQGESGAKSYLVAPNSTVQLWDSESQTIYLKSADASGMPSIKTLDYTIRDVRPSNAPTSQASQGVEYVTRDELKALYGRLEALQSEMEGLTAKQPASIAKNKPKGGTENE